MSLYRRHGGHDHGEMPTKSMDSVAAAATSDMDMSHMGHDMGGHDMSGMSMHMFFTTQFKNYPVLFESLSADTKAQAFGIFVLLFFVAFIFRSFEFFKNYLEVKVWRNPVYFDLIEHKYTAPSARSHSSIDSLDKNIVSADQRDLESTQLNSTHSPSPALSYSSQIFRDIIRLVLLIVPEILGYALMLAVMSYTLAYFFAVAVGSGLGKFFFDKMSFKMGIKPGSGGH